MFIGIFVWKLDWVFLREEGLWRFRERIFRVGGDVGERERGEGRSGA